MIKPDQDRAYQLAELQQLQEIGSRTLAAAKQISEELEDSMGRARRILEEIPSEARTYEAEGTISRLIGTLVKPEYDKALSFINNNIPRLMSEIPAIDQKYASEMETITAETKQLSGLIDALRAEVSVAVGELPGVPLFSALTQLDHGWEQMQKQLEEIIQAMLRFAKGGAKEGQVCALDPINMQTGNYVYDRLDLQMAGAPPLTLRRYYNVQDEQCGSLGKGWIHSFETRLLVGSNDRITVLREDGSEEDFYLQEDGSYISKPSRAELRKMESGDFRYQFRDGSWHQYQENGRIIGQGKADQKLLTYRYDQDGMLSKVERADGISLTFCYNEDKMLTSVTDCHQRTISYDYDKKRLRSASTLTGSTIDYQYDEAGHLKAVINPRKVKGIENRYDKKRRIVSQKYPDGGQASFTYEEANNCVVCREPNGNEVRYYHDEQYRNTRIEYEDGSEWFYYNAKGQTICHLDKQNYKTSYHYDQQSRLIGVTDALDNEIRITYGAGNAPSEIWFNGERQMSAEHDAQGRVTRTADALQREKRFSYTKTGQLEKIYQADGSLVQMEYDRQGNISALIDPAGSKICYQYDKNCRVIKTMDGNGNETCYTYDHGNRLQTVTNALGKTRSYEYNESGRLTCARDFDGSEIRCGYGVLNKPEWVMDQDGSVTRYIYDRSWNLKEKQDPLGGITKYNYDRLKRLTKVTNPLGGTIRYQYDPCGNPVSVKGLRGEESQFFYDACNRLTAMIQPGNRKTVYEYDGMGRVTSMTNPLNQIMRYQYDQAGQLIYATDHQGIVTSYHYTSLGLLERVEIGGREMVRYEYESGGRLRSVCDHHGTKIQYDYDAAGNIISEQHGDGSRIGYRYDCLNRMIEKSLAAEQVLRYDYDLLGRLIKVTDGAGSETHYAYTASGRLLSVTDAMGNSTAYNYDKNGYLIGKYQYGTSTGEAIQTSYERNLMGQLTKVTDPLGNMESYLYDKAGQLIKVTDADSFQTEYGYTADGAVAWIAYGDGTTVEYSYDALYRLVQVKDALGTTLIKPDAYGRAQKVTDYLGRETGYEWGIWGEQKALIYPDGTTVGYEYDDKQNLIHISAGEDQFSYEYNTNGTLKTVRSDSGRSSEYQYDENGRLKQLRHQNQTGLLDCYQYAYDPTGNLIRLEKERQGGAAENGVWQYQYDQMRRLTEVWHNGLQQEQYEFDAAGNRIRKANEQTGQEWHYQYNQNQQLICCQQGEQKIEYTYDNRGNVTGQSANGTLLHGYQYGADGRLKHAWNQQGLETEYKYHGLGQRLERREYHSGDRQHPIRQTQYLVDLTRDHFQLLEQRDTDHQQRFIWDTGIAAIQGEPGHQEALRDHLGSPIRMLGEQDQVFGYGSFGEDVYPVEKESQPIGYTGYQRDPVSNTLFAQAREYDPFSGRFMAQDGIKGYQEAPLTQNPYLYCWGNPIELVDVNGLFPSWLIEGPMMPTPPQWVQDASSVLRQNVERNVEKASEMLGSAWKVAETNWNKHIYGIDQTIVSDRILGGQYAVTGHLGGDVLIQKKNNKEVDDSWSLRGAIKLPLGLSIRGDFNVKNWNPSTWKLQGEFRVPISYVNHYVSVGGDLSWDGINKIFKAGGGEKLPIPLPDGIELDPNMKLNWSYTYKQYQEGSRQEVRGATLAVGVTLGSLCAIYAAPGITVTGGVTAGAGALASLFALVTAKDQLENHLDEVLIDHNGQEACQFE